jgi:hypothetical protein
MNELKVDVKLTLSQRLMKLPVLLYQFYKTQRDKKSIRLGNLIHENRDKLIIILDPNTDKLIMAYKDKVVTSQIKQVSGKKSKVVKSVLKHSQFKSNIDEFLSGLSESLKLKVADANSFFQWVDGAIFNISKKLRKKTEYEKIVKEAK